MEKEGHQIGQWVGDYGIGGSPAPVATTAAPATSTGAAGTWGYYGIGSPRYQVGVLYSAANILADRGDEAGCESVLNALKSADQQFGNQLSGNAGSGWKQQISDAKPIDQLGGGAVLTSRNLVGTQVVNTQEMCSGA
jgi:hypothetical protein